jgi:hypothetical protein
MSPDLSVKIHETNGGTEKSKNSAQVLQMIKQRGDSSGKIIWKNSERFSIKFGTAGQQLIWLQLF